MRGFSGACIFWKSFAIFAPVESGKDSENAHTQNDADTGDISERQPRSDALRDDDDGHVHVQPNLPGVVFFVRSTDTIRLPREVGFFMNERNKKPNRMDTKNYRFETRQIHAGLNPDEPTGSRGIAIWPTAAYRFRRLRPCRAALRTERGREYLYPPANPHDGSLRGAHCRAVRSRRGPGRLVGHVSILVTTLSLAAAGDNIVVSPYLYGGTHNLLRTTLRRLGIDCRMAASEQAADFEPLIDDRTRMIFAESMGNPTCTVPDLEALGELAQRYDVPFVVDNTFGAAGYLCNPFEWGGEHHRGLRDEVDQRPRHDAGRRDRRRRHYNWGNGKFPQIDGPSGVTTG